MAQTNDNIAPSSVPSRHAFFSKPRIIARPGFNRWLVPPAALAVHLCIGMAYGFSVFWLPIIAMPAAIPRLSGNQRSRVETGEI